MTKMSSKRRGDCRHETTTPIKHLVVIFQENNAFDHYFGSYPNAENLPGEPPFHPKKDTPSINGLSAGILKNNQNRANPFRLSREQASSSCNPTHLYTNLQQAMHDGLMDKFVESTGITCSDPTMVMGYFDGNTVTALWNYAQHFSLSDNFFTTNIGASTAGHLNLISGNTHGVIPPDLIGIEADDAMEAQRLGIISPPTSLVVQGTLINNVDPKYDRCSIGPTVELTGINIGNRLNEKGITWGWFQGGFAGHLTDGLQAHQSRLVTDQLPCSKTHIGADGIPVSDYSPHHAPFQYYSSTSNPQHLPPSSPCKVGYTDQANHNYDLHDFWTASAKGNVPAISFFKAPQYQDGHPGYSNPLFEQEFIVKTINRLQKLPQWSEMAIIIAYDDSGGWYDHVMPPIVNQSQIPGVDALVSPGNAGSNPPLGGYQGRPGYGYRVPFLLISPYAKKNYVDHTLIDQTSILGFIEENWSVEPIGNYSFDAFAGSIRNMFDFDHKRKTRLILDPKTGEVG